MDPQPSTPPDGSKRKPAWGGRPPEDHLPHEDDLYFGAADEREDWSSLYGAPPPPPPPRSGPDLSGLFIVLDGLRRAAPAELQGRLTSLIREALLTLRSLIDWYLERLDRGPRTPEVEDIPID